MIKQIIAEQDAVKITSSPPLQKGFVLVRKTYSFISSGSKMYKLKTSCQSEKPISRRYSCAGIVDSVGDGVVDNGKIL